MEIAIATAVGYLLGCIGAWYFGRVRLSRVVRMYQHAFDETYNGDDPTLLVFCSDRKVKDVEQNAEEQIDRTIAQSIMRSRNITHERSV